jgi:alpha-1,2-mannosyltransferase
MSTIGPALSAGTLPPLKVKGPATGSRLTIYVLRAGELVALVLFLSFCIMWVQWQTSGPGVSRVSGDFASFWTAGQLALQGRAADAYREVPHFFAQLALHHDPGWGYLAFFYPPFFLLLCTGLALIGYVPALGLWLVATVAGYAAALRGLAKHLLPEPLHKEGQRIWLLFLGYPAVMVNAGFGQNGFLSAGLFGGAAIWLDRRPELAGLCLGCLAYKPQLGLIVPLALAAAGRWRCFAAASVTVLALSALATLAFGVDIWPAFFAAMADARRNWMEFPNPLYLRIWITVFGLVRLHDGSLVLAYTAQAVVSVIAAVLLVRTLLRRSPGKRSGVASDMGSRMGSSMGSSTGSGMAEIAAIAACVPFCSPFMLEYDLVILAVPMLWLLAQALRDGFRPGERLALIGAYMAPVLFKVSLFNDALKVSVIVAATLLYIMVLRRVAEPDALPDPRGRTSGNLAPREAGATL